MKLHNQLIILCLSICSISYAQVNENLCNRRIERISTKLSSMIEVPEEDLNIIEENLLYCFNDENPNSLFLRGLIEIHRQFNTDYEMALYYFNSANDLGHIKAKTYLGYCYKNGWGVERDFIKAQQYLEEAAALNDETAIYALGYFLLKGINSSSQDYEAAKVLFEQSNNPMAQHWLSIMHLYGLGTTQDINEAIHTLSENPTINSETLLQEITSDDFELKTLEELRFSKKSDHPLSSLQNLYNKQLFGGLYELDWSGENVISQHSLEINFNIDHNEITLSKDSIEISSNFHTTGNKIIPDSLEISLPALILDNSNLDTYTYKITSIDFFIDDIENIYVAKFNTWINELDEPGQPIYSNLMTQGILEEKIASSIHIYPNHFRESFNLTFAIEKPSVVQLKIFDLNGIEKINIPSAMLEAGEHNYRVDGSHLVQGLYLATLIVDGTPFSNQILKVN